VSASRTHEAAPAHTDWLYHHLTVVGPPDALGAWAEQAAGAGTIPWELDLDRMEEDYFLRLASAPNRSLSLQGAQMLAAELRDAVAVRHAAAVARVGSSRACAFDLHVLLPVPAAVLQLGPDDPAAIDWLWAEWGTTEALRHVTALPMPRREATQSAWRVSFWSADWTPWRAIGSLRRRCPTLAFEIRPIYEPS